jgi:4-aminobutyrate aminotransferase-like enzyme
VGVGGGTIKVNPPLCVNRSQILEACDVIDEALEEVLAERA